jgi:hypothetical protein
MVSEHLLVAVSEKAFKTSESSAASTAWEYQRSHNGRPTCGHALSPTDVLQPSTRCSKRSTPRATPPVAANPAATRRATADAQVGAALMFTLVAFTVVEVPLVSYLATPAKTLAVVQQLNERIKARRHALPAIAVGAVGFLLTLTGMGNV